MMKRIPSFSVFFVGTFLVLLVSSSCKETVEETIPNNSVEDIHRVSTIKIENYVNRCFIDLIGRSPLDEELERETITLREANLSRDARLALIRKLQTDSSPVVGDVNYTTAYHQRLYDEVKSRMIEGVADGEITRYIGLASFSLRVARLEGDSVRVFRALEQIDRHQRVVDSRWQLQQDSITLNEMFARMMDNSVYDQINMNTFNFVNASFDDLFYRFPSQAEFQAAFSIIQDNVIGSVLGGFASNKREYCLLLANSTEFYEGLIIWAYQGLLGRDPTTQEVVNHISQLEQTGDYKKLQEEIIVMDEYGNF
jgi:hypothetical protein